MINNKNWSFLKTTKKLKEYMEKYLSKQNKKMKKK